MSEEAKPEWISHYIIVKGRKVPVARPFEYGGYPSPAAREALARERSAR